MKNSKSGGKGVKMQRTSGVRASISFPTALYETLEVIAKQKEGVDGLGCTGRGGKVRHRRSQESRAKNMKRRDDLHPILREVSYAFHQLKDHLPW